MAGNYVLLETIALTQSATTVIFDNIPQSGYTDLKIVASTRCSRAATDVEAYIKFNGNSSNYSYRLIFGTGASVGSQNNTTFPPFLTNCSSSTANTFSSTDIYIPNYRQSTNKSLSVDSVAETNATGISQFLVSGQWANTAAITSIELYPFSNSWVEGSTFSLYGVAATDTTPTVAPKATGGNIVANDGTYWYHAFTTSGAFIPQTSLSCDYLVVAGGGGGGAQRGGGGGAGGFRTGTGFNISTATNIQVGAGGAASVVGSISGGNGTNSIFLTTTSTGGGGGASDGISNGANGGSGGGAVIGFLQGFGNTPSTLPSQGNDGGTSTGNVRSGAGGGGAGGVGANASNEDAGTTGGAGGIGGFTTLTNLMALNTGTGVLSSGNYYYAGGGGGGSTQTGNPSYQPAGGLGGGGNGGSRDVNNAVAGANNTGGGGGGGSSGSTVASPGRAGGSGIVIIRYAMV